MKGLRITIAVLMSLTFTFLLCCTILGWENLTAKEKKEYTKAELDSSYNAGFSAGEESNKTEITSLLAQYNTLNHTLEHLQRDYENVQTNYATLATQKTELENTVAELQSSNEDKTQEIANLNTQLESVNNQIIQLESEKVELNNTINNLNNQIADLEEQLQNAGITFDCYKCTGKGSYGQSCVDCSGYGASYIYDTDSSVKVGDNVRGKTIGINEITFENNESDYIQSGLISDSLMAKLTIYQTAGAYGFVVMPDDQDYIVKTASCSYMQLCSTCNGSQRVIVSCPICGGDGKTDTQYVTCSECNGTNYAYYSCSDCQGSGNSSCSYCSESGKIQCMNCSGSGQLSFPQCGDCGTSLMSGETQCSSCNSTNINTTCTDCSGSGQSDCYNCYGSGNSMCNPCMGTGQKYEQCRNCNGEGYTAVA